MTDQVHPVDEVLPPARLGALGLQHVLVMYAGAVAVPLIISGALGLNAEQRALLINADLLACGLATLVQAFGFWGVGIRLPVMMGVTFASVAPMMGMISAAKSGGDFQAIPTLLMIYGSVIAAGVFAFLAAPLVGRVLRFFPPVVTGTIITVIGLSLMRIGVGWAEGPLTVVQVVDGAVKVVPNPNRDALDGLAMAFFVLMVILGITKYAKGFISNIAVLAGIVAGAVIATLLGGAAPNIAMSFADVAKAPWFGVVMPLQFGMPSFQIVPIITMCIVMLVVMIESTGMFLALGEMTGRKVTSEDLTKGLRADGVGTIIGGLFNTFPYTSFSQNVGLVGVTGVRSRYVAVAGGLILVVLGFVPKLAALVGAVPVQVLGGAGIVMFGMVTATGIRILGGVDFKEKRHNLFIVAISVGFGLIPLIAPNFFKNFPGELKLLLESGIILASIVSVSLNAFFNGAGNENDAMTEITQAASHSDI